MYNPPSYTGHDSSYRYMDRIPRLQLPPRCVVFYCKTHTTTEFTSKERYDFGPLFRALGVPAASPIACSVSLR